MPCRGSHSPFCTVPSILHTSATQYEDCVLQKTKLTSGVAGAPRDPRMMWPVQRRLHAVTLHTSGISNSRSHKDIFSVRRISTVQWHVPTTGPLMDSTLGTSPPPFYMTFPTSRRPCHRPPRRTRASSSSTAHPRPRASSLMPSTRARDTMPPEAAAASSSLKTVSTRRCRSTRGQAYLRGHPPTGPRLSSPS